MRRYQDRIPPTNRVRQWTAPNMNTTRSLTARVNQPFSAFLALASRYVVFRTAFSRDNGGAIRDCGLRSVRSCSTLGGRCLTIVTLGFKRRLPD